MQQVFISYPRDNASGQQIARELLSHLKRRQIRAFFDEEGIQPGERWLVTLKAAVAESRVMLWVISASSHDRQWQEREFNEAQRLGVTVIPVLAEDSTMPLQVNDIQAVFLFGERKQAELEKLLTSLEQRLGIDQLKPLRHDAIRAKQNERYDLALEKWQQLLTLDEGNRQALYEIEQLQHLKDEQQQGLALRDRLLGCYDDIEPVFSGVAKVLKAAGRHPDYDSVREYSEKYLAAEINAQQYIRLCQSLFRQTAITLSKLQTNYSAFAQRIIQGEVALFVGSGLQQTYVSADEATTAAVGAGLVRKLAERADFGDFDGSFSALAEYYRLNRDYGEQRLFAELRDSLDYDGEAISLYRLLGKIDEPLILISSAYDDALENSFDAADKPYVELTSLLNRCAEHDIGHLVVRYSDKKQPERFQPTDEQVSKFRWLEEGYSLIFNIRGTCHREPGRDYQRETLTITEQDYFNFARYADKVIPDYLANQLKYKGLLFAGLNPVSWEERLLVDALLSRRKKVMADEDPRAVGRVSDPLERVYWEKHKVQHGIDLSRLDEALGVLL